MDTKTIFLAVLVIAGFAVILGLAYTYGPYTTDTSGDEAVEGPSNMIFMSHDQFTPDNTTVKTGKTVFWINKDWAVDHQIVSDSKDVPFQSAVLKNGDSFNFTFTKPGIYIYHDNLHPSATGIIIVQD
jgi:plastocyanin